jgi:integrase
MNNIVKWSRHRDPNRKKSWEARTWIDRKRKSRFFSTRLERDQFIKQNENFTDDKYEKIRELEKLYNFDSLKILNNYINQEFVRNKISILEAIEDFLNYKRELGASKDHLLHLKGFLRRFENDLKDYELNHFTLQVIENYLIQRTKNPITFRNYRKYLNIFFNWAMERNLIQSNPVLKVKSPKLIAKEPEFLTIQQARNLIESNRNEKYFYQIVLQMFAGIRSSACWQIKYSMIDFKNRRILIPANIMKSGKRHLLENLPHNFWQLLEGSTKFHFEWDFRNWKWEKELAFRRSQIQPPRNVLRKSFATYLCGLDQSAERCAYLMSHRNSTLLYTNYKGCVSQLSGKQYFSIN